MAGLSLKVPDWLTLPPLSRGGAAGGGLLDLLLSPRYPSVAFDLASRSLAMVRIGRRKKERFLASYQVEELPADLIEMDFQRVRLVAPERLREIVERMVGKDQIKTTRISLIIPDTYARVAIIPFDELPRRRRDALQLVRWKTKKGVPFKVDDAAVDFVVLPGSGPGASVLAVLTPRGVLEAFEGVFSQVGIQAGLVDLCTLSLINFYLPILNRDKGDSSECLIVNVSAEFFSFVVFRRGEMVLFRCKPLASAADDSGETAIRLLRRELQASLLYYREKLQGERLEHVYLRVLDLDREAVEQLLAGQSEIGEIRRIDPRQVMDVNGRFAGEQGEALLQRLAPALGATLGRDAG